MKGFKLEGVIIMWERKRVDLEKRNSEIWATNLGGVIIQHTKISTCCVHLYDKHDYLLGMIF